MLQSSLKSHLYNLKCPGTILLEVHVCKYLYVLRNIDEYMIYDYVNTRVILTIFKK